MSSAGTVRLFFVLSFVGFLCLFLPPKPASATAQSEKPFVLRSDVELVAVEVAALDKNGKPISNLKKDSFTLLEDGKQQEILSFDEVVEGKGGLSPKYLDLLNGSRGGGKTVIILFDDGALSPENIKRARDSASQFVKEHMKPQDWFAIASFGYSLTFLQNLTDEPQKIYSAIAQPAISMASFSSSSSDGSTAALPGIGKPRDQDPQMQSANYQAESMLNALQEINSSLEKLKGQKAVLIYSQSNYISPKSVERAYKATLTSAKRANVVYYTVDPAGLTLTGSVSASSSTSPSTSSTIEAAEFSSSSTSSSSASATSSSTATTQTTASDASSSDPIVSPSIVNQAGSGMSMLKALASETGGSSIFNTNKYDSELANVNSQLSNYYILGFSSNNPKHNGELRKLNVKIDQKGIALKYRDAYLDRAPVDMLASSKKEAKLLDALASSTTASQLPVSFRSACFFDSSSLARMLVFAEIGMEKAAINKKNDLWQSDLNIMGVAYAENGSVAGRFSETLHLKFEHEHEQDIRKKILPYRNYFRLQPGKYRLKLAVSDESNNVGTMEQTVEALAKPQTGIGVSSLVVMGQRIALPALVQNIQAQLLEDNDPLIYNGMQVSPSINQRFPVSAPIPVLFRICNNNSSSNLWKLEATARLETDEGEEIAQTDIDFNQMKLSVLSESEAAVGLNLSFPDADPGKYKLIIEISEAGSSEPAKAETDIELTEK